MPILNFTKIFVLPLFESDEMFKPTDKLFDFIEPKNLTWVLIIFHKILQVHWNQNQPSVLQQNQGLFVWRGIGKQLCTLEKKPVITKQ